MTINQLIEINVKKGFSLKDAQNLVAEEIVLKKIASSNLAEHITLKGGIVMYNLTKNYRRVTQDIDFDFIRYSIDEKSIKLFINKMNTLNDGFHLLIDGELEQLSQEEYQGVRVHVIIKDKTNKTLKIKLDIGVHTYTSIEQENTIFVFDSDKATLSLKVNSLEQILAEKIISLARLGVISTRYKDIYDIYYLIKECGASSKKVGSILELFMEHSKKGPKYIFDLQNSIEETLSNQKFADEASKPVSKWIDVEFNAAKKTIIDFVNSI